MEVTELLRRINNAIVNPIILLAFSASLLVFFWGIVEFIRSETVDKSRAQGQRKIIYGLVGMLVMISAYGIIGLILDTLGLPQPAPGYIRF